MQCTLLMSPFASLQKEDSGGGLLLPAAVASIELVESRTNVLLCSKVSIYQLYCMLVFDHN